MKTNNINKYLNFLKTTQKLKNTLGHAWTEDINRQESTADHSWHMAIMAIAFSPELKNRINQEKVFQLIAVHDLGEAITGDIPAWAHNHGGKATEENEAVVTIANLLPNISSKTIIALYKEYKARETNEARFVKMLDVIDHLYQHLISSLSTWVEVEYTSIFDKVNEKYFLEEPFMLALYNKIILKLKDKVKLKGGKLAVNHKKKQANWKELKEKLALVRSYKGKRGNLSGFIAKDRYRH